MSIELSPTELAFRRPLTREVVQTLHLTNKNYEPIAFKVKTTAPKQYCVRPNSGRIEAGQTVEVQVLLQPMKEDPPPGYKCRDKFQIQSVLITEERDAMSNVAQIWSYVEKTDKGSIQEKKIRVVFTDAEEGSDDGFQGRHSAHDLHDQSTNLADETALSSHSPPQSPPYRDSSRTQQTVSSQAAIAPGTKSQYDASDDLQQKLAEATRKIAQLEAELKDQSTLRQRKGASNIESAKTATAPQPAQVVTEGIPVQIAAALCLVSFLLAFFFF